MKNKSLTIILFPQKACLKVWFSSYLFFCFCLPFQKSIFYLLFVHQPLFTEDSLWGFFSFSLFAFSFPKVCLFTLLHTNFPNIPFLKPNLLSFLAVSFFSVVLVFVFIVYVSAFLFFIMLVLFLVFCLLCFVFLFLSSFLFCFQSMKKLFLPCNSGVF